MHLKTMKEQSVSEAGQLQTADDIDGLTGQEQELVKLVNHLEEASTAYDMPISAEKTQLMTNNTNGISTDITIDNKKLETPVALNIWELLYRMRDPSLKYCPG